MCRMCPAINGKGKAMTRTEQGAGTGMGNMPWRLVGWGFLAALLALPAVAMRFTAEVQWTASDFLFMGLLLAIAGGVVEFAAWLSKDAFYRAGAVIGVLAGFLLIWVNLAVGILGGEGNPYNLLFALVLAAAMLGALITGFRAPGMAHAMTAAAAVQLLIGLAALTLPLGSPGPAGTYEAVLGIALFTPLWLLAAALFHIAGRRQVPGEALAGQTAK